MNNFITRLKALADERRFQIINLLLTHDLCVGALAQRLGISKPAVSQHLQVLRKAGLVIGEKRGYWTHYAVKRAVLSRIADELIKSTHQPPSSEGICHKVFPDETTYEKQEY
jgi:DNA-binding transcriptional ArsR family regulator